MKPAVSVIIPTFNRAEQLPRAIRSVLTQAWADFELLVVDDGSTDETSELLARLDDRRVRCLRQENQGVSSARNLGLRHARGRLVTFLDSDDEAHPDWLAVIAAAAQEPTVGVVTVGAQVAITREVPAKGRTEASFREKVSVEVLLPRKNGPIHGNRPLRYALSGTMSACRDLLLEVGGYAEHLHFAENSELALRLVPACLERGLDVVGVRRPLITYHRDPSAWRGSDVAFQMMRVAAEYILEHHGDRLRGSFPTSYANYRGVAGVNAARLGDMRAARGHLLSALRVRPFRLKNYLRLAVTLIPPVAARFWRRYD